MWTGSEKLYIFYNCYIDVQKLCVIFYQFCLDCVCFAAKGKMLTDLEYIVSSLLCCHFDQFRLNSLYRESAWTKYPAMNGSHTACGAGITQLVVLGLAVHSVAGSILLWGHFPVEGIFPLELTWVQTPFPQKLFQMRV